LESRKIQIGSAENGMRVDQALPALFPELSRKRIKRIIDEGGAYRNKKRVARAGDLVKIGDILEIFWVQDNLREGRPVLARSALVAENSDYLVLSKPPRLPCQATLESIAGTVIEALDKDLGIPDALLVHRLDKETSGLLVVARNPETRGVFEGYFQKHIVKKSYLAIVAGSPKAKTGVIKEPIEKDSLGKNRYKVAYGPKALVRGKSAETGYRVLAVAPDGLTSLIEFLPVTGRTHQIRVHSAQCLGCPLLGDKTYGAQILGHPVHRMVLRHMLHAHRIKFPDPSSATWVEYTADIPDDFKQCLTLCGIVLQA
jgi:23S rRNA pseudouridine1911/1915/1917 synthase